VFNLRGCNRQSRGGRGRVNWRGGMLEAVLSAIDVKGRSVAKTTSRRLAVRQGPLHAGRTRECLAEANSTNLTFTEPFSVELVGCRQVPS
jgi:hypothetical protein